MERLLSTWKVKMVRLNSSIQILHMYVCLYLDMKALLNQNHSRLGDDVMITQYASPPNVSIASALALAMKPVSHDTLVLTITKPFINCFRNDMKRLEKMLTPLCATISTDVEKEQVIVNPCAGCERMTDWKTKCQSVIESYQESLVTETVTFPGEIKNVMLSFIISYIQDYTLVDISVDEDNLMVSVSGEQQRVNEVKCKIEDVCDSEMPKKESVPIDDAKFLAFLNLKINELLKNNPEISATVDHDDHSISITGTRAARETCRKDLDGFKQKMACVKARISNEMVQFLSTTLGKNLLQSYLQGYESVVTTHFDSDGSLVFLCSPKYDGINVAKKVQDNLVSTNVPYPAIFVPSFKSEGWATLQSNLEEAYHVSVNFHNDKLTVIGDKKSLGSVKQDIQQFIENECHAEKSVPLCGAQWRLLTSHMVKKWSRIEQKIENESKIKFVHPDEKAKKSSILLKGEKPIVADFAKEIEQLISSICTSPPIEQARPGTVKFFYSDKGTTLISGIEAEEKSCIQLDILQDSGSDDIPGSEISGGGSNKLCMGTTKEGKVITLVLGNITEFPVDVIVNAANCDLKHVGGVAFAIASKGGPIIQEESNRHIRREGKLSDGDAIMTTKVGKLPCNRLVHAVGPKWNGGLYNEEAFLKRACLESLKLAGNFKTVSFPAISSGVYGFPISKCAACMIKAFVEYSARNALSALHEIIIVLRDRSPVGAFSHEMNQHLNSFHSTTASVPATMPAAVSTHSRSKRKKPSGNPISKGDHDIITQFIKLHKGELLKQKVSGDDGFIIMHVVYDIMHFYRLTFMSTLLLTT